MRSVECQVSPSDFQHLIVSSPSSVLEDDIPLTRCQHAVITTVAQSCHALNVASRLPYICCPLVLIHRALFALEGEDRAKTEVCDLQDTEIDSRIIGRVPFGGNDEARGGEVLSYGFVPYTIDDRFSNCSWAHSVVEGIDGACGSHLDVDTDLMMDSTIQSGADSFVKGSGQESYEFPQRNKGVAASGNLMIFIRGL